MEINSTRAERPLRSAALLSLQEYRSVTHLQRDGTALSRAAAGRGRRSLRASPGPQTQVGRARGGYSHCEVVHEALPTRRPLQEVVHPALDVAAAQQRFAEAIDGDAGVQADRGPRAFRAHHHHIALHVWRPFPRRCGTAACRRPPALPLGERRVVGVRDALGQLQRGGLLAGRHTALPRQGKPAQAPALVFARGRAGGHG